VYIFEKYKYICSYNCCISISTSTIGQFKVNLCTLQINQIFGGRNRDSSTVNIITTIRAKRTPLQSPDSLYVNILLPQDAPPSSLKFKLGVCILLRMYQLNIKTPTFATNISACFYFMTFFTTCFGPDQWPSSGDIV
jgi:hypothetical protein